MGSQSAPIVTPRRPAFLNWPQVITAYTYSSLTPHRFTLSDVGAEAIDRLKQAGKDAVGAAQQKAKLP